MMPELTPSFLNHLRYLPIVWNATPKSCKMDKRIGCRIQPLDIDTLIYGVDSVIFLN